MNIRKKIPLERLNRTQNRDLNLKEYEQRKTVLLSLPRYVLVELTQGCNLKCPMCRAEIISCKDRTMTDELFERIIGQLFGVAEMVDLRGWGESLILPGVEDYIQEVNRCGAKIRFVTNLAFKRDKIMEILAKYACHVAISIDTADETLYKELRGGADFGQFSGNLDKLVEAYLAFHGTTDLLHFTTTVQRPALLSLPNLVRFAASKRIKEIRLFSVTIEPASPLSIGQETEEVDRMVAEVAEVARGKGVRLVASTRLGMLLENPPGIPPCVHPWSFCSISYNGSVGFCDHLIGPEGEPFFMGKLCENDFPELWNGLKWQNLRQEHISCRRPDADKFHECAWCYRNRYIDFEHRFFPKAVDRIKFLNH